MDKAGDNGTASSLDFGDQNLQEQFTAFRELCATITVITEECFELCNQKITDRMEPNVKVCLENCMERLVDSLLIVRSRVVDKGLALFRLK
jgi:hypothetical protein